MSIVFGKILKTACIAVASYMGTTPDRLDVIGNSKSNYVIIRTHTSKLSSGRCLKKAEVVNMDGGATASMQWLSRKNLSQCPDDLSEYFDVYQCPDNINIGKFANQIENKDGHIIAFMKCFVNKNEIFILSNEMIHAEVDWKKAEIISYWSADGYSVIDRDVLVQKPGACAKPELLSNELPLRQQFKAEPKSEWGEYKEWRPKN